MPTGENSALDKRRLRRLIEAGRGLVAALDPDVVLDRLLEAACEMTGAHYAAIGVLDADRHELERFITRGVGDEEKRAIGALPRGRGVLGLLIAEPKPLRLVDVGEHPRSYGFPPGHPPMKTFLGVPILIRGEAWGNLYLTDKEGGGEFDERDEQVAVVLAEWTAIAVDNARLYHGSEEQRDALEQAVRGLEATTEIARAVGGETDIDRILETVVKRARALVEARSLAILLEDHGQLRMAASAGEAEFPDGARLEIHHSAPGEVLQSGMPSRVRHLAPDLSSGSPAAGEGAAALLVPLNFRGKAVGVLVALDPLGEASEFSGESERILSSFAVSAATAVATAQNVAHDRLRKSIEAAERERGRWARELHDESLQSMAGVRVLLAQSLREGVDREALVERAIGQVDTTIAEMRRLIADLRPPALDELGLAEALGALAERLGREQDFDVALSVDLAFEGERQPTRLTSAIEDTIFRVVQEAVNNVVQHAGTSNASVTVRESESGILIEVADAGAGFEPAQDRSGFGLRGMRERVELVGGALDLRSAPGEGTRIAVELPAERRAAEAGDERSTG